MYSYLSQGVLLVCLFVRWIRQKVLDGFALNSVDRWGVDQEEPIKFGGRSGSVMKNLVFLSLNFVIS